MIPRQFLNSVLVPLGVIATTVVLSSLAGYSFARGKFRARTPFLFGILSTEMITGLSTVIALYLLAARLKLLDSLVLLVSSTRPGLCLLVSGS